MTILDVATVTWLVSTLALMILRPYPEEKVGRLRTVLWVVAIISLLGFIGKIQTVFGPMLASIGGA